MYLKIYLNINQKIYILFILCILGDFGGEFRIPQVDRLEKITEMIKDTIKEYFKIDPF